VDERRRFDICTDRIERDNVHARKEESVNINFAEIRAINIESVIRHYGWENRRQGNTLVLKKCPLPSHTSSDVYTFKASVVQNLWTRLRSLRS
jgi:hypothetical protein